MLTNKQKSQQTSVFLPKEVFLKYKTYFDGLVFWKEQANGTFEVKQVAPDKNLSDLLAIYRKT